MSTPRTWNPREWEAPNRWLVSGEAAATLAAALAVMLDWPGTNIAKWGLYATAFIAAGTLTGYALARTTEGDRPLTGIQTRRIAKIAQTVNMKDIGLDVDWSTITPDSKIAKVSLMGIPMEGKRNLLAIQLSNAAHKRGDNAPDRAAIRAAVDQMSDEEVDELLESMGMGAMDYHVGGDL